MKSVSATLQTGLSVREAADVFQIVADQARGLRAKLADRAAAAEGVDRGFFTPRDDSPFSGLDDDRPHFTVGVSIGRSKFDADVAQLYAWDRGDHRQLELYSPYRTMGRGRSVKLLGRLIEGYQRVDQHLRIVQGVQ